MAKVALAEVLWRAANEHLNPRPDEMRYMAGVHKWSCWAIGRSLGNGGASGLELEAYPTELSKFLSHLGLRRDISNPLNLLPRDIQQSARYMWLLLAMHVAEDEQIYIEV